MVYIEIVVGFVQIEDVKARRSNGDPLGMLLVDVHRRSIEFRLE